MKIDSVEKGLFEKSFGLDVDLMTEEQKNIFLEVRLPKCII